MSDGLCAFHAAQKQVVILRTVILLTDHAGFLQKRFPHHGKVRDIVVGTKQIDVDVRLKVRLEMRFSIHVHLVFIRVDHVILRTGFSKTCRCNSGLILRSPQNQMHGLIQCVRRQQIVMI